MHWGTSLAPERQRASRGVCFREDATPGLLLFMLFGGPGRVVQEVGLGPYVVTLSGASAHQDSWGQKPGFGLLAVFPLHLPCTVPSPAAGATTVTRTALPSCVAYSLTRETASKQTRHARALQVLITALHNRGRLQRWRWTVRWGVNLTRVVRAGCWEEVTFKLRLEGWEAAS